MNQVNNAIFGKSHHVFLSMQVSLIMQVKHFFSANVQKQNIASRINEKKVNQYNFFTFSAAFFHDKIPPLDFFHGIPV